MVMTTMGGGSGSDGGSGDEVKVAFQQW